ncbi:MAG: hypothetical protein U0136_20880 [Bdellovibrionota bacterium]
MIQFVFASVFFLTTFPVLAHLFAKPCNAERPLLKAARISQFSLALFFVLFSLSRRDWLPAIPGSSRLTLVATALRYIVTTPIHETGHFLFSLLGETPMVLGGSLFELIVPALLLARFLYVRCSLLASGALFFLGYHMIHVGEYMSTARHHEGMVNLALDQSYELHDWYRIFQTFGLLEHDTMIGALTMNVGSAITALAVLMVFFLPSDPAPPSQPLLEDSQ